jgi:hypothetical protein
LSEAVLVVSLIFFPCKIWSKFPIGLACRSVEHDIAYYLQKTMSKKRTRDPDVLPNSISFESKMILQKKVFVPA